MNRSYSTDYAKVTSTSLRRDDIVLIEAGDFVPADGEVIEGAASVDESAITGESAPVIRESGGDFSSVTGGTRVLSDWLVVRVVVNPGEAFLDRMIAMVESASRQKTPNEIALTILLVALTLIFLLTTVTLLPFSIYSVGIAKSGTPVSITVLVALLVCLIPTTIGGLLSAIGVAGIGRMMQKNVIATSGRAIEAAGDVDVLLLEKPAQLPWVTVKLRLLSRLARPLKKNWPMPRNWRPWLTKRRKAAALSFLPNRNSRIRERNIHELGATFVAFSAQTRMSGVNIGDRQIRKGAADAIRDYVEAQQVKFPEEATRTRR